MPTFATAGRAAGDQKLNLVQHAVSRTVLKHASTMLGTDVHPGDRAELLARQAVIAAMAHAHAALADAAVASGQ